ncbi:hypothetical protein RHECNPAF_7500115 [Rhizobium etli CNPAF512]|nr:hypothetical protein RHECNPAF_7500115 [Rhizobium etli CNPAF512]
MLLRRGCVDKKTALAGGFHDPKHWAELRRQFVRLIFLEHLGEVQEADHAVFRRDDAFAISAVEGGGHFRHRLDLAGRNGQNIRDAVDEHANDHAVNFGDDDGAAFVGDGALHAELVSKVDDRDHRAAQVHDADDIGRRVRDRRGRRPATDFADGRGLDAEFLIMQAEGNDLERIAAEASGIDRGH